MRERRRGEPSGYSHLPEPRRSKVRARHLAGVALRRGKLSLGPCENCGNVEAEMHHADYSKPLEVTWLCRGCHLAAHAPRPTLPL